MADSKDLQWITVNGKHIPIGAGETKADAIRKAFGDNRSVADHNEDVKEQQIAKAKAERDRLNGKSNSDSGRSVDATTFHKDITSAKESRPVEDKWRVDVHTADDYKEHNSKCWTSKGGSTVAVTDEGDIISVCKKQGDNTVRGKDLLAQAVKMGGRKLDSFAGNHKFYTANGFEPISWTPFNKDYAPDGWDKSGCGEEEVVFYKYVGIGNVKNTDLDTFLKNTKPYVGDDGYDNAYAYRDRQIKEKKGEQR